MIDFCREIRMPEEVTEAVATILESQQLPEASPKLFCPNTWAEGLREMAVALGEDPRGLKMLAVMLCCAQEAWRFYERNGISQGIYLDTMACFSRFVREHRESFGVFGFDRAFWTVRQISCRLYRVGELEYELTERNSAHVIGLHIPSDACLEQPLLRQSVTQARELVDRVFPTYVGAEIYCQSWLLSPTLAELLPEVSRIRSFQRYFAITPLGRTGDSYRRWVFKDPRLSAENYPEHTTLQRALKKYLLSGGQFQEAEGVLREARLLGNQ